MIDHDHQSEIGLLPYSGDRKEHRCNPGFIMFQNYLVQC